MQKDSTLKTLLVAAILCVACSILVSGAAVSLKERQQANIKLDIKKNLLLASGVLKNPSASKEEVLEAYKSIQAQVIDLETGEEVLGEVPENFDQVKASKNPATNKTISPDQDLASIKVRAQRSIAYKYVENGEAKMIILPVNGKGLWSTLYGFLALSPNTKEVQGIGFYKHGETPGLGGEIDNPSWKALWKGKKIYNDQGQIALKVVKGMVPPSDTQKDYKVDGLSGATITSNGVTGLVQYWLGSDGFGPYLKKQRALLDAAAESENEEEVTEKDESVDVSAHDGMEKECDCEH